ncbi:ArnT family glycosyltransferase [Schlesneria paludicola]|uniref:ArnT family glycosyltransferase n=1 Tax=Schlesneria paludicola TaxID=360056 RepID=UPI00029A04CD|nr:glycosyltransferase family 39 protein [Schlesneria paludicola]
MSSPRRCLFLLIAVSLVVRLAWAATLETGQDEAYHFLYTVHPDWSYFDHPPMLRYVAQAGISTFGGWLHPLSLRFGFVLMFGGATWIMFTWTARWFGEWAGFYAALALNLSAYYTAAAGAFVLPDGPLLFFALLTMWRLSEALVASPGRLVPWLWVGLACAGAMLSKYHAVFLPLGALVYILVTPSARRNLLTPGPYFAADIGLLGLVPVLIWNAQHDWASFGFQTGRAVGGRLQIGGLAVMLFGPMALLLPWIWYSLIAALIGRLRSFRTITGIERLLICQALVPLVLFGVVSCTRPILPHWPLIGFLPLFPMLGADWAARSVREPIVVRRWLNFMTASVLLIAGAFVVQARFGLIQFPFRDPCIEISGWDSVGRELQERGLIDRPNTFLFTSHWFDSGQVAFAVRNRIPVTCYRQGDARGFAYWSRPEDWVGHDGILIDTDLRDDVNTIYAPYFREVDELPSIEMTRGGRPFRTVRLYLFRDQQRPFPFAYERTPK